MNHQKKEYLEEGISKSSQSFKTNNELNNGKTNFKTKEIEVYRIEKIYEKEKESREIISAY